MQVQASAATTAAVLFGLVLGLARGQTKIDQSEDGMSGTISFSTPDLNDEEGHSPWVPDPLKCDACKAVAFQLWDHFDSFNKLHKYKKYNLPESDLLEITEEVCEGSDIFNRYGIKPVNKVNRLSGPGTETSEIPGVTAGGGKWPASYGIKEVDKVHRLSGPGLETADTPGVTAGGGKWPYRLKDLCNQFMGRVGETKVYGIYRKNPKSKKRLEDFLCRGPADTARGECSKPGAEITSDDPRPKTPMFDEDDLDDEDDWDKDEL